MLSDAAAQQTNPTRCRRAILVFCWDSRCHKEREVPTLGRLGRGMSAAADCGCRHLKQAAKQTAALPNSKLQIQTSPHQSSHSFQSTTTLLPRLALTRSPRAATPNFRDKVMHRLYIISRHHFPFAFTCRSDSHVSGAAAVLCRRVKVGDVLGESGKKTSGPTARHLLSRALDEASADGAHS